jgi:hypothetical protein
VTTSYETIKFNFWFFSASSSFSAVKRFLSILSVVEEKEGVNERGERKTLGAGSMEQRGKTGMAHRA